MASNDDPVVTDHYVGKSGEEMDEERKQQVRNLFLRYDKVSRIQNPLDHKKYVVFKYIFFNIEFFSILRT